MKTQKTLKAEIKIARQKVQGINQSSIMSFASSLKRGKELVK